MPGLTVTEAVRGDLLSRSAVDGIGDSDHQNSTPALAFRSAPFGQDPANRNERPLPNLQEGCNASENDQEGGLGEALPDSTLTLRSWC